MKNKKTLFFIIFILIVVPISVNIAIAEGLKMQTAWPVSPITQINLGDTDKQTITHLIAYIYEWGIALGGLVAFVALLIAGFTYMTSVGDPGRIKEAIERIKSAFLGLALLLGSYLILHTINPELTTLRPIDFEAKMPEEIEISLPNLDDAIAPIPCTHALICTGANFTGNCNFISVGGTYKPTPPGFCPGYNPGSLKFCKKNIKADEEIPGGADKDKCATISNNNKVCKNNIEADEEIPDGDKCAFHSNNEKVEIIGSTCQAIIHRSHWRGPCVSTIITGIKHEVNNLAEFVENVTEISCIRID